MKSIKFNKIPLILSVHKPTLAEYGKVLEEYNCQKMDLPANATDKVYKNLENYFSFAGRYSFGGNNFFKKISEKDYDAITDSNDAIYSEIRAMLFMPINFSDVENFNNIFSRQITVFGTGGVLKLDDKILDEGVFGTLIYEKQSLWKTFIKGISETLTTKERDRIGNPFELKGYRISREDFPSTLQVLTRGNY